MEELVESLKNTGVLKTPNIIGAFLKIDRKDFVPKSLERSAYLDEALPIGEGQTISQPYTVAFMFELLEPKRGEKIMDVGHGSGWTTALLSEIVGKEGKIYAFERVRELCKFGERNLKKYPELFQRVSLFCRDASHDLPESIDGIICAAELSEVPAEWREKIKIGGRLVYPKDGAIFKEIKTKENGFRKQKYPGFAFVPYIQDQA
ncbi:hypothetical protein A3H04_02395 [Candidatus Giovannonibacteria bacterium RIFCSPLOWO2_12_FULL_43_11c]|uniref:Protein-L-isoaspartate O-methyltransferase n=1 Tax=Candidatus Giovannonibacteria bacterium RIFCSPHIGHO2_12_FULL_43_15 TaxID=1798341 RepID=A0A1F5WQF0_9BACT|nr:MAG: hypothetical protein A3B97_00720 [Candidatus Giovannonibacteria bacterium RIFCSPHIGHO2_02_FULL_43_32]OGF77892.1 MAG: hypothetical protein A3F23_02580 [Candidatus Giovannonibacteria bacterium RIFCSPHIGHO2_12_FULL_43_15]OGF79071.1 MAG: hypothetical protein A3A15_03700 [Candidatus Giovannonibacteria bacterium RIFCSPLOWO2_01_FULL_43_60]OGF92255.1 MAG: hypothetical protein A3H04_02395 [Candidatus Giovannonibacteria bacterium RIFCSPLOWO2_12_FULL_43_11c]